VPLSPAQTIECFHLGFLAVLRTRLDESRYVLKGGANLRFFFGSVRYSEDIDLDVSGVPGWKLADQVDSTLSSEALRLVLRSAGVRVDAGGVSTPKQTETTRRWKIPLLRDGATQAIRTKVEFSARNGETRFVLASVPTEVVSRYAMRPPTVQHYLLEPAVEQKVLALARRNETQARDVFDLDLLLTRSPDAADAVASGIRTEAAEAGLTLDYAAFEDQVTPFLDPPVAALYDRAAWEQMQRHVIETLLR